MILLWLSTKIVQAIMICQKKKKKNMAAIGWWGGGLFSL